MKTKPKLSVLTAAWQLMAVTLLPAQTGPAHQTGNSHVHATVRPSQESIGGANHIHVVLSLKNVSQSPIWVANSRSPEYDVVVIVTDSDNKPVPLTRWGRILIEGIKIGGVTARLVEPGGAAEYDLDLSKLYEVSKPGLYHVTVRYANSIMTREGPLQRDQVAKSENVSANADLRVDEHGLLINPESTQPKEMLERFLPNPGNRPPN